MRFETDAVQDIRLAQVCCSPETVVTRSYLQGILMTPMGDKLQIVGTDGHRLTKSDIELTYQRDMIEEPFIIRIEGYIPTATVRMEFDVNPNKEGWEYCGKVMLFKAKQEASFKTLFLKRVNGTYPDWRRVVQPNFTEQRDHIAFNPTILAEMAEAAGAKGDVAKLSFADGQYPAMRVDLYKYSTADRPDRVIRLMPGRY